MKYFIFIALLLAACTIAPTAPKPRQQPILSGNSPITITPTHNSAGAFTGYITHAGYVDLLNSLYSDYGYLLTPPRSPGFGITDMGDEQYKVTAEAERNRIILQSYRDMGKPKQGIVGKLVGHL